MKIFGLNKTDGATGALETIEVPHFELHEGNAFICDGNDTAMGDGDTLIIAFKTANTTQWPHLTLTGWSLGQSHMDVIENCSWTTNTGTKQPLYNIIEYRMETRVWIRARERGALPCWY